MKKKLLSMLLVLVLCITAFSVPVHAEPERITSGDWVYILTSDGATLMSYEGSDTDVVVPAKIDGHDVYCVGTIFNVFSNVAETMTSVTLENGIHEIGIRAFRNCTALKTVTIPGSVTYIGSSAFEGCTGLTEVKLEPGIRSIGSYAFYHTGLSFVTIPSSVNTIDDYAFGWYGFDEEGAWEREPLKEIFGIFGYRGSAAQEYAQRSRFITFYALDRMTETSGYCGEDASWRFEASTGTLYIEGEGDHYPIYNSIQPWIAHGEDITRAVIGEGIWSLTGGTFSENYPNLTEVILPESLTAIEGDSFRDCTGLKQIEFPAKFHGITGSAFRNTGLREVNMAINDRSWMLAGSAFADCKELTTVWMPRNADHMGYYIFRNCPKLTNVYFTGDAYLLGKDSFLGDTLTAWYPAGNETWTEDYLQQYGGNVTWNAYDPDLFLDVAVGSFYHEPIVWAVENGITSGTSATTFSPAAQCNRAQVVTFLWAAAGKPEPESNLNPFVDVPKGSFYEKPVLWAVEQGITSGTDATHFNPAALCNRATVVTFLWAAAGKPADTGENPFSDVPAGAWYEAPVLWARENGITSGISENEFGAASICNRAQVVTFLYKAYNQ